MPVNPKGAERGGRGGEAVRGSGGRGEGGGEIDGLELVENCLDNALFNVGELVASGTGVFLKAFCMLSSKVLPIVRLRFVFVCLYNPSQLNCPMNQNQHLSHSLPLLQLRTRGGVMCTFIMLHHSVSGKRKSPQKNRELRPHQRRKISQNSHKRTQFFNQKQMNLFSMGLTHPSYTLHDSRGDEFSVAFEALVTRGVLVATKEGADVGVGREHLFADHADGRVVTEDEGEEMERDSVFVFKGLWGHETGEDDSVTEIGEGGEVNRGLREGRKREFVLVLGEGDARTTTEFRNRVESSEGGLELGNGVEHHLTEFGGFVLGKVFVEALGLLRVKGEELFNFGGTDGRSFLVVVVLGVVFIGKDIRCKVSGQEKPTIRDFTQHKQHSTIQGRQTKEISNEERLSFKGEARGEGFGCLEEGSMGVFPPLKDIHT